MDAVRGPGMTSMRRGRCGSASTGSIRNRALWDREQIAEGVALLSDALSKGSVGPYQLQAAIAAVHDDAWRAEHTDWQHILARRAAETCFR